MRLDQTTAPTVEAVSIADAMAQCGLTDLADAGIAKRFASWVKTARSELERATRRQLVNASWTLYLDEFPATEEIELRILPVSSITSVKYYDTNGTLQTLSASTYQSDLESPDRPGRLMPAYGYSWPSTRSDIYKAVQVVFVAGYGAAASSVPSWAVDYILTRVADFYQNRESTITGTIIAEVPHALERLASQGQWGSYT